MNRDLYNLNDEQFIMYREMCKQGWGSELAFAISRRPIKHGTILPPRERKGSNGEGRLGKREVC